MKTLKPAILFVLLLLFWTPCAQARPQSRTKPRVAPRPPATAQVPTAERAPAVVHRRVVVNLRKGDSVAGEFAGADDTAIQVEVAGNRLRIKLDEVISLIFTAEGAQTAIGIAAPPQVPEAAGEAIRALRKMAGATEVGISYQEYGTRLIDLKAAVDEAGSQLPDGDLKNELRQAMEAYADAARGWGAMLGRNDTLFPDLEPGKGLMKKYSIPIDNSIGMALLPRGTVLTVIWRAARERIERAAALAGGKTPAGVAGGVQGAQGNPQPDADTAVPVESPAPTAAQRLRSAEQFANAGNAFGAISEMREAIKLEPNNALYRAAIGLLFVTQRRWSEAEPELREAIRLEPTNAAWHRALAGVLYDQRKLAEAEVEAREAVRLDPNNLSYRTALGDTLFQQQKYAEAETEIREALRLNPNEPVAKELLKKVVKAQKPQKK